MKVWATHHLAWQILVCHVLLLVVISFINEADAKLGHVGWAKSDTRTKQILANLRARIAQQQEEEEAALQKGCDPNLSSCKASSGRGSGEEEDSEEDETETISSRFRGRPKTEHQPLKLKEQPKPAKDRALYPKRKPAKEDVKSEKWDVKRLKKDVRKVLLEKKEKEEEKPKAKPKIEKPERVVVKPKKDDRTELKSKIVKSEEKKNLFKDRPKKEPNIRSKVDEKKVKVKASRKDEDVQFPEDVPVLALTSDAIKTKQCQKHSRVFLRQLQRYKLWALMMYDSTAKLPAGILQGNVNQYGDFDQCLSINATFKKHTLNEVPGIEGKYCLATIDVTTDSNDPGLQHAISRSQSFAFIKSKVTDPGQFIPRFSTANWGICIPSVCTAEDLEMTIRSNLGSYRKSSGINFDVKVDEKNCVTKRDLIFDFDAFTLLTIAFYLGVIGLVIHATREDYGKKELPDAGESPSEPTTEDGGNLKAMVMAFSLKKNAKKLFVEGESEDSIQCIHGIKSIFTVMLYLAHKTIPLALTPFANRVLLTEMSNRAGSAIFRASIIYTDSFLLISGVLTSFNLAKEILRKGRILWIRRIVARYIRLTPALLATILFYAYASDHLGSGPMWNTVVKENSLLCQNFMWRNLLYIQNLYPFQEMCAAQTHQLALDMQLFVVSPVLVYILYKYDKIGIGILQALIMISTILRFTSTSNNELALYIYHGMPISQLHKTANHLYAQPLHRATPYILGVIIGYYLQKSGKNVDLPRVLVIFGWVASFILALLSFVVPAHLARRDYVYDVEEAAQFASLLPILWSIALGWFITACHLGYGGKINEYLRHKALVVFSRISYSVYLTQFLVFSHIVGTKRIPEMFSISGSLDMVEFAVILAVSTAFTLLFDIPTMEIKTILFSMFPTNENTQKEIADTDKAEKSSGEDPEPEDDLKGTKEEADIEDEEEVEEEAIEDEYNEDEDIEYDRLDDAEDQSDEVEDTSDVQEAEEEVDFWANERED